MHSAFADPPTLAILFGVAVLASGFDAIAGGGGLITLPALLLAGLDPVAAIATNKVQSSFGATAATLVFARRGLLAWPLAGGLVVAGLISAALGSASLAWLPRQALSAAVPLLLIGIALYFALAHRPAAEDRRPRLPVGVVAGLFVPLVGFYDGIFGPGTGLFLMFGFVTLAGFGLVAATAHSKLANAASNIGALAWFAASGHVEWRVGLVMAAGAVVGGQAGSRLALRHGARLIRPLVVLVCCVMAMKLIADPANPLRRALAALVGA